MLTKYLISYGHMPIIKTIFTTLTFVLFFENITDPNQIFPKSTDPDLYCFHHSYSIIGPVETSLFVCFFVALRPMSTAMVIARWSVYLTTLVPGQA